MTISYVITYSVIYDQVKTGSLESRAEVEKREKSTKFNGLNPSSPQGVQHI